MSTDPARGASDWLGAFFKDADQLDLPLLMSWFSDDIDLRIGNHPPVVGRADVEEAFRQFWATLSSMQHERQTVVVDGDSGFQGSIVSYGRLDGTIVPLPVASHLRRTADGRLDRLWIYIDLAPLFAQD